MKILIFGAGVQGTLCSVRLVRAGHDVTLIARGRRAAELREIGATIRDLRSGVTDAVATPVSQTLAPDASADLCFIFVRREQIDEILPAMQAASRVGRFVCMFNHANGSEFLFNALGKQRVVLGFPGAAGSIEDGIVSYLNIPEQPTVIERTAPDVAALLKQAGFRVSLVADMDAWLKRHAVFITAVAGALHLVDGDMRRLAADPSRVREMILAVREGWHALDHLHVAPAPLALRSIFSWVPLPFAVSYWRKLLASDRGEIYFARHGRHAVAEMAVIADDVRGLIGPAPAPNLQMLYDGIDAAAKSLGNRAAY